MKKLILALVLVIAAAVFPQNSEANMLVNPGFESPQGSGQAPDNWEFTGLIPYSSATTTTDYVKSGNQSVKLWVAGPSGGSGGMRQRVTGIEANDVINASTWARITQAGEYASYANVRLEFEKLVDYQWVQIGSANSPAITELGDWNYLYVSAVAPEGTQAVSFNAHASGNRQAEICFDDADLSVVPEPASLFLLGSGLVGLFSITRKKS